MELLIVIAIIGIFSAVILASLDQSRVNASDASIKENLITIRSQAAIYFDTNASYGAGAFYVPPTIQCSETLLLQVPLLPLRRPTAVTRQYANQALILG